MKLREVLILEREPLTEIKDDQDYTIAGVQSYGKGIVNRRNIKGHQLKMRKYKVIKENQLMWCKVDTKNGAFGITKKEHVGSLASTNMAIANINLKKVNPEFIQLFFTIPRFYGHINSLSTGTTNRKYLTPDQVLDLIEIPSMGRLEQDIFMKKFILFKNKIKEFDIINNRNEDYITKLKQQILQEAVQGKLVPQDPKDKPASELLKKVKIKKAKPYTQLTTEDNSKQIPSKWAWIKFGNLVDFSKRYPMKRGPFGSSITKSIFVPKGENTFKVYEQKNAIYNDATLGHYYINKKDFEKLKAFEVDGGDIIISCSGTIGKIGFLPENTEKGIINQALLKLCINEDVLLKRYFGFLFEAYMMKSEKLIDLKGTAMKNIPPVKILQNMPIPLPPLPEQIRIVEKVDKLMAYCDKLEGQIEENQKNSGKLMEAVLKESFEK